MPLEMNKVKHRYMDTFCFHNSAKGACQFPLGVEKKKRANQLQCIGLYIESCLAAARTANHDNVEIVFMSMTVGTEAHIFCQNVIFFGVFCVSIF